MPVRNFSLESIQFIITSASKPVKRFESPRPGTVPRNDDGDQMDEASEMARIEADREDLFAEFRSAIVKWELRIPDFDSNLVLGVRRDERLSIYFGSDPCYHFDAQHRLLRAYANGFLYRTQGKTLARLSRERTPETTTLNRHDLSEKELNEFMQTMAVNLASLSNSLLVGTQTLLRSNTDEQQLVLVQNRISEILSSGFSLAPVYRTRKV